MSMDRSLKAGAGLIRHRNVLTRMERLDRLAGDGKWDDTKSVMGLVKVGNRKKIIGGKAEKADDATAVAGAPAAKGAKGAKGAAAAPAAKGAKGAAAAPAAKGAKGAAAPAAKGAKGAPAAKGAKK